MFIIGTTALHMYPEPNESLSEVMHPTKFSQYIRKYFGNMYIAPESFVTVQCMTEVKVTYYQKSKETFFMHS